jgi:molecular chaperone Hsp33
MVHGWAVNVAAMPTQSSSSSADIVQAASGVLASDQIVPFSVSMLDIRGRTAQFGATIDQILKRHNYPEPVARLLAEVLALTAMLGSSLKYDGKFIIQAQGDGPVNLLVADLRTNGALRGYARFDANQLVSQLTPPKNLAQLLGKGVLAFTVDQGAHMQRYQGLVAMEGQSIEDAAIHYFRQSEQLPTEIRLAVAKLFVPSEHGGSIEQWRAGGLIAQFMPQEAGRIRIRDLPPGDAPDGADLSDADDDDDAWTEARVLVKSIEDSELTDPTVSAETLLYRLFNQHDPRITEPLAIRDECSCSEGRILDMLRGFDAEDRAESIVDGKVEVTCEFCSKHYAFSAEAIEA